MQRCEHHSGLPHSKLDKCSPPAPCFPLTSNLMVLWGKGFIFMVPQQFRAERLHFGEHSLNGNSSCGTKRESRY